MKTTDTAPRLNSSLALTAAAVLALTACTSGTEPAETSSASETASANTGPAETSESADTTESTVPESGTDEPTEPTETDDADDAENTAATQTFTSQGGTFSFDVPEDWTTESVKYSTDNLDYSGVPYEVFNISSPKGDIVITGAVHGGPTSGDGWRSQYWELADVQELDVPVHEDREHVYLRTDLEWLGEDDEAVDPEQMGWESGDYRLVSKIVSQDENLEVGETDPGVRQSGWAYWTPLPGNYDGETSIVTVTFNQELIEALTGETEQDAAVNAFLDNEWYQTTTEILSSMEYEEPNEADLPIDAEG